MYVVSWVPPSGVAWLLQTQVGCLLLHTVISWALKKVSLDCRSPASFPRQVTSGIKKNMKPLLLQKWGEQGCSSG